MQADTVAREAFCRLAACPSQAYATLACKLGLLHLVDLYHWLSSMSQANDPLI